MSTRWWHPTSYSPRISQIAIDDLLAAVYAVLVFLVALTTGGAFGVRS